MRALPFLALLALAGCAASPGTGEQACTAIGAPAGVSVDVASGVGADGVGADTAALELCWDGSCRSFDVTLRDTVEAVGSTCGADPGDTCSARARETGGHHGFAPVRDLPDGAVEVALTVFDADGGELAHRALRATPQQVYPNGPECGEGVPQLSLDVAADGSVSARR